VIRLPLLDKKSVKINLRKFKLIDHHGVASISAEGGTRLSSILQIVIIPSITP
jgi:hypothetical protein